MKNRIYSYFLKNKGLLAVTIVLFILFIANFRTNIQLLGWDNFSVSLDLNINFWRSFTTWRDYRGLGVASDSEVVDLFRIIILGFLNIFFRANATEYIYTLLLYATGVVSAYFLTKKIVTSTRLVTSSNEIEIVSALAAILYGHNLHALEVFYFPIAIYTARFAFLPLLLSQFLALVTAKKISMNQYFIFILVTFLLSTTYLTGTIFLTVGLLLLFVFPSFLKERKNYVILGIFFIFLNSFWLLPFLNYSIQKSALIPQASSFTSVNELLLNKPSSEFSFEKILTFYPETLNKTALPFQNLETGEQIKIHPLVDMNMRMRFLIFTPILFVCIGLIQSAYLIYLKKNSILGYVVLLITTIFFLRKTLPPFGFIYENLVSTVPLFAIIFRFAGTKFYPLLLIGEVILFAIGLSAVLQNLPKLFSTTYSKNYKIGFVAIIFLVIVLPFSTNYKGMLINDVLKVKLPPAYTVIAQTLKDENPTGRILHLPFDQLSYWRSYSWGYMGSAFLSFMVEQPVLDRTFEPASTELDYFVQTLFRVSQSKETIALRAQKTAQLLTKTGTEFILFDETIGQAMTSRNLKVWGIFNQLETKELLSELEKQQFIYKKQTENIDGKSVTLYALTNNTQSPITSYTQVLNIDSSLKNTFIDPLLVKDAPYIQDDQKPARTFPFWQPNKSIIFEENSIKLTQMFSHSEALQFNHSLENREEKIVNAFIQKNSDSVFITLSAQNVPALDSNNGQVIVTYPLELFANDREMEGQYLNNWSGISLSTVGAYRLMLGDTVLPLPLISEVSDTPILIGSLISQSSITVTLLAPEDQLTLDPRDLTATEDPNCYQDKIEGYEHTVTNTEESANLTTTHGMTCLTGPFRVSDSENKETDRLFEALVPYAASTKLNESDPPPTLQSNEKYHLATRKFVDNSFGYVPVGSCLLDLETPTCLNQRQYIKTPQETAVIIQASRLTKATDIQLLIDVPGGKNHITKASFGPVIFRSFKSIQTEMISLPENFQLSEIVAAQPGSELELRIPYLQNKDSFIQGPLVDSLQYYSGSCEKPGAYRQVISPESIPIVSYVYDCLQGIYVSLPYNPSRFYLWMTNYTVQAGKQPIFRAHADKEIKNEYLSRYQGYPNLKGFKELQKANNWFGWSAGFYDKKVANTLENATFYRAHTVLPPFADNTDEEMFYEINQHADGFSLLGITSMNVLGLPQDWYNLSVDSGNPVINFSPLEVFQVKKIWPSIWQATVTKEPTENPVESLLVFGQAFDTQWHVFTSDSIIGAFLGVNRLDARQVKVNGWSNGWVIPDESLKDGTQRITILYIPERLLLVGWLVTLGSIAGGGLYLKQRKADIHLNHKIRHLLLGLLKFKKKKWL